MKSVYLVLLLSMFHQVMPEFNCEIEEDSEGNCNQLGCHHFDGPEEKYRCRCKISITGIPLPNNRLMQDQFHHVCAQHPEDLEELWINDVELRHLDEYIFRRHKNLKRVNLARNHLRMNFDESASELTSLDLSHNSLKILEPLHFLHLKSLQLLNMSHNSLKELQGCFKGSDNLEQIYLNNNQLMHVGRGEFESLGKLRILDLAHNYLVAFEGWMINIQELYLDNNKLNNVDFSAEKNNVLGPLQNNFSISDISNNQAKHIQSENFKSFGNLMVLKMNNNFLNSTVLDCDNFRNLKNVNVLDLSNNQISKIYNCTFERVEKLKELNLLANKLKKLESDVFKQLTDLKELNLGMNQLEEIPLQLFSRMSNLKKLNISNNKIDSFDVESLMNNKNLTELDIQHNKLRRVDMKMMKEQLLELKVIKMDSNLMDCRESPDILQYFIKRIVGPVDCSGICNLNPHMFITLLAVSLGSIM